MPTAPAGIVSSFFYDTLKQDDIIDVRAPSGKFFLDILSHKPVVLVAGGIGITPLISMLDAISDSTAQRETWFFLSVTNKQNHFMQAHVAKVADEHEHIHLYICYSHPQPEDIQGHDYDHAGRVNLALLKKYLPSNNFEFYLCGSAAMIDSLKIDLAIWGVAKNSIYYEQFSQPKKQKIKGALNADKLKATVLFSNSNKSLEWCEGGDSILDLALATGVYINCSCKRGMCGQCQTTIKSGEVFYNEDPEFLPNLEKGMCLPCVARTKQRLESYA